MIINILKRLVHLFSKKSSNPERRPWPPAGVGLEKVVLGNGIHHTSYLLVPGGKRGTVEVFGSANFLMTPVEHQEAVRR